MKFALPWFIERVDVIGILSEAMNKNIRRVPKMDEKKRDTCYSYASQLRKCGTDYREKTQQEISGSGLFNRPYPTGRLRMLDASTL